MSVAYNCTMMYGCKVWGGGGGGNIASKKYKAGHLMKTWQYTARNSLHPPAVITFSLYGLKILI